jgi:hypothetical protein
VPILLAALFDRAHLIAHTEKIKKLARFSHGIECHLGDSYYTLAKVSIYQRLNW